ncbi:MAG: response regulator transcription factor [Acidobacteria bacterium]|nr:response regulator transcription factor [Acidobacteriota bacterium]MBV9475386.1 response regulator transcription factor [Acidobacteriota bacterium]
MTSRSLAHVLVLDPDPSIRALLVAVLRRCALQVTASSDALEAADALRFGGYAAVIVSSDTPELDALLREFRHAPPPQRPKIILTTTPNAARYAPDADAILLKPFHLAELQATVAAYCSARAQWPDIQTVSDSES